MFAVIEVGGHQYKVAKGDVFSIDKQDVKEGEKITVKEVLLFNKDGKEAVTVGMPYVSGATVELTVKKQHRGEKIRVFRMKAKKRQRKTFGHRSYLTEVEVTGLKG